MTEYKEGDLIFDKGQQEVFRLVNPDMPTLNHYPQNFRLANAVEVELLKRNGLEVGEISTKRAKLQKGHMVMMAQGIDTEYKEEILFVSPIKWNYLSGIFWHTKYEAELEIIQQAQTKSSVNRLFKIEKQFLYDKSER